MFEGIFDAAMSLGSSAVGGSVFGLLGSAAGRALDVWEDGVKEKRALHRFELQLEAERELAVIEAESARAIAEGEAEAEIARADSAALAASYAHDSAIGTGSQWVINTLRLVRPILTLLPISLAAYIAFVEAGLREDLAAAVIFLMNMTYTWWFGDRSRRAK